MDYEDDRKINNALIMNCNKENVPHSIDISDIQLPEELDSLLEAMAKNAHEIWAQKRINQGRTYGEKRDNALLTPVSSHTRNCLKMKKYTIGTPLSRP